MKDSRHIFFRFSVLIWSCTSGIALHAQSFFPLGDGLCCLGAPQLYGDNSTSTLYMGGGAITCVDNLPVQGMATWNGMQWDSMGFGVAPRAIVKFNGEIVAGGVFQSVSGNGLSKWNGSSWVPYADVSPTNVRGMLVYNNDLYVYGAFDSIGGIAANRIAKFDGVNWSAFPILDTAFPGYICCAAFYNGELYVGGNFEFPYQSLRGDIAKWDGNSWQQVGNGLAGSMSSISDLEVYNNELWIGGGFETAWGDPGNYLVKWNGSSWSQLTNEPNGFVQSLFVYGGKIYAGGSFAQINSVPNSAWSARWAGSSCESYGIFDNQVTSFTELNSELYIGGGFWTIDGDTMNRIARYAGALSTITPQMLEVSIFPNPTSSIVQIACNYSNCEVQVFNTFGQVIETKLVNEYRFEMNFRDYEPGIYFINVRNNNFTVSEMVLVE